MKKSKSAGAMSSPQLKMSLCAVLATLAAMSSEARAQFAPPACDPRAADSTCYQAPGSTCVEQPAAASRACPAGYVGQGDQSGTRDSCSGEISWDAASQNTSACTNCGNPLSTVEVRAIQNAILGQMTGGNRDFTNWACSGCSDGTMTSNPINGLQTGRTFRGRVWVPDAFAGSALPTTNRVNYLAQSNQLPAMMPEVPGSPGDNSTQKLYARAMEASAAVSTCSNNDMDHCNVSCTPATGGHLDSFCSGNTLRFNAGGCSDAWEIQTPSGWRPTRSASVPYTGPENFTRRDWDWSTILGWNGVTGSSGAAYMCNSTVNYCTGWILQSASTICVASHTEPTYDQYGTPTGSVTVCDRYGRQLSQYNDCTGGSRSIMEDALSPSCGGAPAPAPSCGGGMSWTGSGCSCPSGQSWSGSYCFYPVPPPPPPPAPTPTPTPVPTTTPTPTPVPTTTPTPTPVPTTTPTTTPTPTPTVTCWTDSWPNTESCPAGQTGSITSTSYMTCPNGPYGQPAFSQGPVSNTCASAPPPAPSCSWYDWNFYCDLTVLTPNNPGDSNYEEETRWGWRTSSSCGDQVDWQEGYGATRGGAYASSSRYGSQGCGFDATKDFPPPHCNLGGCSVQP